MTRARTNADNALADITGVTASTGLTGTATSGTATLSIDSTVATLTGTQALTNKDLSSGTNTLPTSVVTLTGSQTLTNKTLTSPIISSITNTGTLTLPTTTGTVALTSDITVTPSSSNTLTNKTIDGSNNTITNVSLTTGVTGTLPVANGGTGITSLGTGVATFLGTPTSANLIAAVTDETGTGALVFGTSPTLTTPNLGTPSALTLTNATGLPVSGITASTSTALGVGSVELGHATDTTISRVSAGVVAIEGVNVVTTSSTDTLTNKTLTTPNITQGTSTPTFTTNAYTLVSGDAGKLLLASNSATAGTVNVPTNASVGFATGTQITILQTGSGQLTISATTPATTTILSTGATAASPKCRAQYSAITLIKTATDTWYAMGDIA